MSLIALGNALATRFEHLGEPTDIDTAITAYEQAADMIPSNHPFKGIHLCDFGSSLVNRFEQRGELADLDRAITILQQAVTIVSDNDSKAVCLGNVAACLAHRFDRLGQLADLATAITAQQQAIDLTADDHRKKAERLSNLGNLVNGSFNPSLMPIRAIASSLSLDSMHRWIMSSTGRASLPSGR